MPRQPERPVPSDSTETAWGSDAIAQTLRDLGIEYISLNPGASFRGLHDSLVNYLGNEHPQMLLCLHEEHAIGMAHGYAKVTERPMAVAVHSNVGLMHASMGIFNAFCDRVPMLVIGATGPLDAVARRPWIDWLHTATDQAALVRSFLKWDDQPGSVRAAIDSIARGFMLTTTPPNAPVYLCLDASLQEERLTADLRALNISRHRSTSHSYPDPQISAEVARLLSDSENPVILAGRVSRSETAWLDRIELAERIGARVFTHLKLGAAFPTRHPLHGAPPATFPSAALQTALREADIILSLDWLELGGALDRASAGEQINGTIVSVSLDQHLHHGWGQEHMSPAPADFRVLATPDAFVSQLLRDLPGKPASRRGATNGRGRIEQSLMPDTGTSLCLADLGVALDLGASDQPITLIRVPNGWPAGLWHFDSPLDFLGADGGEGVGSGLGLALGAALALEGTGRLPVAILGDGDFLMGVNALWTAARYGIPLLIIVANNRSFFNDELHQQYIAEQRGRPVENRWIGQRIDGPPVDISAHARAQGASAYGPIESRYQLMTTLHYAIAEVQAGGVVVVDVLIATETYSVDLPGHVDSALHSK
jgi:thiamine pyrophosphate-dependent acetolactate synthase large subunit-like protein